MSRGERDERRKLKTFDWGGELWQMTDSDEASMHSYYDLCPWSEDGENIVFCAYDLARTHSKVCWMKSSEGIVKQVDQLNVVNTHSGLNQQWLPGGRQIAFSARDEKGRCLKVINIATGETSKLDGAVRMFHPQENLAVSHTNHDDEAAIARRDTEGIFLTELDSGRRFLIVSLQEALNLHPDKDRIKHTRLYIKHTKWSPDGRKLFFVFTNEIIYPDKPKVKSIFSVNADGSGLRHLFTSRRWNHPAWHPDGRRILLNASNEQGEMKLCYLSSETGKVEEVTSLIEGGGGHPSVSPNGKFLVVEKVTLLEGTSGNCELFLLDLEKDILLRAGSFPVTDHSHSGTHVHPVWSKDSSAVLYNSDQSGHSELFLLKIHC